MYRKLLKVPAASKQVCVEVSVERTKKKQGGVFGGTWHLVGEDKCMQALNGENRKK